MHRRTFFQLLAAAAAAPRSLVASARGPADTPGSETAASQLRTGLPSLRVVSGYPPAATPGMPGPHPGRVVAVKSDKCVDASTGAANDEIVRDLLHKVPTPKTED